MTPAGPAGQPEPARLSASEQWAAEKAAAAMADYEAAAARRRRQPPVVTVERPEDGPSADERRAWAVAKAREAFPVVLRPGGPPVGDIVLQAADGTPRVLRNTAPPAEPEVIRPGEWDAAEQRWAYRQRKADNEALVKMYGLQQCLDAGIITREDAGLMELDKVRQVKLPPGLGGM
jgi:hypothetical protein